MAKSWIWVKFVVKNIKTGQTFIKAIFVHRPINIEVLSGHQGELCFRMLIRPIIRIVTATEVKILEQKY